MDEFGWVDRSFEREVYMCAVLVGGILIHDLGQLEDRRTRSGSQGTVLCDVG
jgi:hypothetical protein